MTVKPFKARLPLWPLILSLSVALIFCGSAGMMLLELRGNAQRQAEESAQNLVNVIVQDVSRNVELIGLALEAVVRGVSRGDVLALPSDLRQLVLFDRSASARNLGALVAFNEKGEVVYDAAGWPPRKIKAVTDRDYFQAQAEHDAGLFVSVPYQSRLLGSDVVGFSRRISMPDGSFSGVALGTIQLSYFTDLFRTLKVGRGGMISLLRADGTMLARQPSQRGAFKNVSSSSIFTRMEGSQDGTFVARSEIDGQERLYTFKRVPQLALLVAVGLATDEIYSAWWSKAAALMWIAIGISAATIWLTWVLVRELRRRIEAERLLRGANRKLANASLTDPLTGLANRRKFDQVLSGEAERAKRTGRQLSLILIDADCFKQFNDLYGHAAGDEALRMIAGCLREAATTTEDVACRIGGEEFALVFPGKGLAASAAAAEAIRASVLELQLPHGGSDCGHLSVSIGIASISPIETAPDLFRRADSALYDAKRDGRNRVVVAREMLVLSGRAAA
jgi:diguanylate cyclase (GGDEF)-like protein